MGLITDPQNKNRMIIRWEGVELQTTEISYDLTPIWWNPGDPLSDLEQYFEQLVNPILEPWGRKIKIHVRSWDSGNENCVIWHGGIDQDPHPDWWDKD